MTSVVMVRSHFPDVRLEKEAVSLVRSSFSVSMIVWDRGRLDADISQRDWAISKFGLHVPPGSFRVALYLPLWWLYVFIKLFRSEWEIVHAADLDTLIPSLVVAKIRRKKIVYDIFDFYGEMIHFPFMSNFFRAFFSKIEIFLIHHVDSVIIADDSRINQIGKDANINIITINNSPDPTIFDMIEIEENKDKSSLVIFFGGGVQEYRGITGMIDAVRQLDDENVKLIIMGYCGTAEFKRELIVAAQNLENVQLHLNAVPYSEIIKGTLDADLLFALYDPSLPNNRFASPNKLFEAMMCQKPIIVSEGTSMADVVRRAKCGLTVPYGDTKQYIDAIITLQKDVALREEMGRNGRRAYDTRFGWNVMENRLAQLYNSLIG